MHHESKISRGTIVLWFEFEFELMGKIMMSKLSISDVIFSFLAFRLRERDHILFLEVFLDFSLLLIFLRMTEPRSEKNKSPLIPW